MRRKIEIQNRTHWRTRDLRRFAVRAAHEAEAPEFIRLTVSYNRQVTGSCSGRAVVRGHNARLMVPSQSVDRIDLVGTLVHEFGHLRGLEHAQMRGNPRWQRTGDHHRALYAWAESLPLELVKPKPAVRATGMALVEQRRAATERRLRAWLTRQKRAATAVRKLRARLRYYDRRAAAIQAQG